jgi:succinoglycan biosynthesis transport protein ExoP
MSQTSSNVFEPGVLPAFKQQARLILLFSALAGALTFVALSLMTPRDSPAALAAFAALATLLLGLAFTMLKVFVIDARRQGGHSAATGAAVACTEPLLPRAPSAGENSADPKNSIVAQSASGMKGAGRSEIAQSSETLPLTETDVVRVSTMGALARRIVTRSDGGGYRTLVAGETDLMGISSHAIELAKALTELGQSVILLDWSPEGDGIGHSLSLPQGPGLAELLRGGASFEQIVHRMAGSDAHVIGAGLFDDGSKMEFNSDLLNLVLDALDEAYDQVIVAGRNQSAREFFSTIDGRVDCGVLVADAGRIGSLHRDPGFEVAEIDLIRYDRQFTVSANHRPLRVGRSPVAAAG